MTARVLKSNLRCVVTSLNHGSHTSYTAYVKIDGRYYKREYTNPKKTPKCVVDMATNAPVISKIIFGGEVISEYRGISDVFAETCIDD